MTIELEISELTQLFYVWIIVIISTYAHEIGHYISTKHYFPDADSKFVWMWAFLIPTPYQVLTENLNGNATAKQVLVILSAGPIIGLIVMIIPSYFLLNTSIFIVFLIAELLSCKGDFEKIYITIKEVWEKKKASQGT